jgi:GDP-L-fucose synthase
MEFKNKKILVTGGSGFIGVNLILKLLSLGAVIRATIHENKPVIDDKRIEYFKCDLEVKDDCIKVCKGIDYVFLCAAHTSGAAVIEKTPLVHLTPNIIMNTRMLEAAYENDVKKLLFISSNVVYPAVNYPVKEEDCINEFFDKYFIAAWMKRFSEIICEMYSTKIKNPMETVVVRPANVYGPFDDFEWETSHVLPALMRKVIERHSPINVWGTGEDIKDFIYIDDFIEGIIKVFGNSKNYDIVNIASGQQYQINDLLKKMIEIDGFKHAVIQHDKTKPTMIPKRIISAGKAENIYDFKASTSIEEGLTRTMLWYKNTLSIKS